MFDNFLCHERFLSCCCSVACLSTRPLTYLPYDCRSTTIINPTSFSPALRLLCVHISYIISFLSFSPGFFVFLVLHSVLLNSCSVFVRSFVRSYCISFVSSLYSYAFVLSGVVLPVSLYFLSSLALFLYSFNTTSLVSGFMSVVRALRRSFNTPSFSRR